MKFLFSFFLFEFNKPPLNLAVPLLSLVLLKPIELLRFLLLFFSSPSFAVVDFFIYDSVLLLSLLPVFVSLSFVKYLKDKLLELEFGVISKKILFLAQNEITI